MHPMRASDPTMAEGAKNSITPLSHLSKGGGDLRMPEVSIRTMKPPPMLPSSSQKYFYTTPDASFNEGSPSGQVTDHLLGAEGSENFAYGEANRLGTQAAYLNVPHMVPKNICPLILPSSKREDYGNEPFALPFPHLRKGDLAFYLRLENSRLVPARLLLAHVVNSQ